MTGAALGSIPFQASFADGDLVSYVVEDSGGTIKAAGIGTYVVATNSITRNDTWNYNGTVVDKNPATNITLSAGTHTIRCDVVSSILFRRKREATLPSISHYHTGDGNVGAACWNTGSALTANRVNTAVFTLDQPTSVSELAIRISTSDATTTNIRMGIYDSDSDGRPKNLLAQTVNFFADVGSNGSKVYALDVPLFLPAGTYHQATVTDSTALRYYTMHTEDSDSPNYKSFSANGGGGAYYMNNVIGALPSLFVVNGASILNKGPLGLR